MARILIVEDEQDILSVLEYNLRQAGHDVTTTRSGRDGLRLGKELHPDLILLDLMLPNMSGYELCRKVRTEGVRTPIVMLTARGEESDRVLGLDLGADDYITKPFSVRELLARVRAVLRRTSSGPAPDQARFGDVTIDFKRFEASRGGTPLEMTRKEFGLLRLLIARAGEVVTREELLDEVWGYDATPTTRTVDNHVASLRAKIEAIPAEPRYLQTVFGVGYKWVR
jgi:two-component system alkaline phosphatase synthesis response regulator PhoP